jgi:hypothetical protein
MAAASLVAAGRQWGPWAMANTIAAIKALRPAAKGQLRAMHYQAGADDPLAGGA